MSAHRVVRWPVVAVAVAVMAGLSCVPEVVVAPPEVGSVTISGAPERLYVGSEVTLTTTVVDTRGLTLGREPVAWASTNAAVARVDDKGRVRGEGAGTATITATAGVKSAPVVFTVIEPVASVSVAAAQPSVVAGETVQLTATPRDGAGAALTGRVITWASSDTMIATVSATGLVTAKAYYGTATRSVTFSAASEGRSGTLAVPVVPVPVASVVMNIDSIALQPGASRTVAATLRSANGTVLAGRAVVWSSTDTTVATVMDTALVARSYSGGATRSARVIATSEGRADTAVVVVHPLAVEAVSVSGAPADSVLLLGATLPLTSTLQAAGGLAVSGRTVTWTSSAPAIATVSTAGVVTPVAAGLTTITASSEGKSASTALQVRAPIPVPPGSATQPLTTTVLDGAVSLTVPPGAAGISTLSVAPAPIAPADDRSLAGTAFAFGPAGTTFSSPVTIGFRFDPSAVLVAKRPKIRAALVTAAGLQEVPGGSVDLVANVFSVPVSHFSVYTLVVPPDPATIEVVSGGGQSAIVGTALPNPIRVRVLDSRGRPISRERVRFAVVAGGGSLSDTASVVTDTAGTVSTPGQWVLGGALGEQRLSATVLEAAVSVTIAALGTPVPVASVTVTAAQPSVVAGDTVQLTATPRDGAGAALTGRVITWASSDTMIATVSAMGLVTAKAYLGPSVRTIAISASSENRVGTQELVVLPVPVFSVSVTPASLSMPVDSSAFLVTLVRGAKGEVLEGRVIHWFSSDSSIASVSDYGSISARSPGSVSIRAVVDRVEATVEVTVRARGWADIDVGNRHKCGVNTGGEAFCWGANEEGQLGDSSLVSREQPVRVKATARFHFVRTGDSHTCGLDVQQKIWCWGRNSAGQLGNGTTVSSLVPVRIASSRNFVSVDVGSTHTCAVTTDSLAYCWGENGFGQLGDGTLIRRISPTAVTGSIMFTSVSTGWNHTCAMGADGSAYCWGDNALGQVGAANISSPTSGGKQTVPFALGGATSVSAGAQVSCFVVPASPQNFARCIGQTGEVYQYNYLFDQFPGRTFVSVAPSNGAVCGILDSGEGVCWGDNTYGRLGLGSALLLYRTPQLVPGATALRSLRMGWYSACSVSSNGEAFCWGQDGVTGAYSGSPVRVLSP